VLDSAGYFTGITGKGVDPFKYGGQFRELNAAGKAWNKIRYGENSADERFTTGISNINYFANFKQFMQEKDPGKPFYFWFGAYEPHREFEKGSWKRMGKSLEDVDVPGFLPDTKDIRGDLLDYAVEIEWFDLHLQRMIDYLEEIGELDNTIIIVTSDNGMAFPRAKANVYEYGIHVPLAVSYPKHFLGGRTVPDLISFIDFVPTILDLTGTSPKGMQPVTGKSFSHILYNDVREQDRFRDFVLAGRERHSSSRYKNLGYPQRAIRQDQYLFIWNMEPERWPAGAPQRLIPDSTEGAVYPMYGIDENGIHHSDRAFTDIDACPSKSFIVENHEKYYKFFEMAVAKRPEYELFDIEKDPYCRDNLADKSEFTEITSGMKQLLKERLAATNDPRVTGPDKDIFDSYKRYLHIREFPPPSEYDHLPIGN